MKVRMTQTLATVAGCYTVGSIVDFDDKEANRLVDGGIATKDLSEQGAATVPPPPSQPEPAPKGHQRQKMDRPTSTPIEGLRGPGSNNNTQPSQTAASVENQARAEVDKHGTPGEDPAAGEAAHKPELLGAVPAADRAAGTKVPQGESPVTTKAREATAGQTTQDTEKPLSGTPSPNAESPAPGANRGPAAKTSTAKTTAAKTAKPRAKK